jgi:hypothetical protein
MASDRHAKLRGQIEVLLDALRQRAEDSPRTVEELVSGLDEKSIGIMVAFGSVPYFSRPPANQFSGHLFDQGVQRLRELGCLKFDLSEDGKLYAYHWTTSGKQILEKYKYNREQQEVNLIDETPAANSTPTDPNAGDGSFFLTEPYSTLSTALEEAKRRNAPIFLIIYDNGHPKKSKLAYSLGYFMEYETTKKMVAEHFVCAIVASSDVDAAMLVPKDDPLENCLWVVLTPDGEVQRSESVYANPDEGMSKVKQVVSQMKLSD